MRHVARKLPFREHFGEVLGPFDSELVVRKAERNQRAAVTDVPNVRRSACKGTLIARKLPFREHFGEVLGAFWLEVIIRKTERNQCPTRCPQRRCDIMPRMCRKSTCGNTKKGHCRLLQKVKCRCHFTCWSPALQPATGLLSAQIQNLIHLAR